MKTYYVLIAVLAVIEAALFIIWLIGKQNHEQDASEYASDVAAVLEDLVQAKMSLQAKRDQAFKALLAIMGVLLIVAIAATVYTALA